MIATTNRIKESFMHDFHKLGTSRDQILNELDAALYKHPDIRESANHFKILHWANNFLQNKGVR
jgi:hypothetical protein